MDPLSITASVLTVSETVLATLKVLQIAYGANEEILSLSKSVSDFEVVLKTIDRASQRPGLSSVAVNDGLVAVRHLLDSAKAKLLDLQGTLDKKFSPKHSGIKSSVNRLVWVKERKRVKQIIQELQLLKIDILSIWGPIISLDISQVLFTLEKFVESPVQSPSAEKVDNESLIDASLSSTIAPYPESILRARNSQFTIGQRSDSLSGITLVGNITENNSQEDLAVSTSLNSSMGWSTAGAEKPRQDLLPVHRRQTEFSTTEARKSVISTPQFLQNFLGFLCLVYLHGEHRRPCRCLRLCNCVTTRSLSVTFQFPHWLLSYALTVLYTVSNRMGPEFLLRTPKVRPANSDLFLFACSGNLEGMRSLFRHGLASPFDIEYGTGLTALHKAVDWRQFEIIDLLRAEGADPFQGDYNGWTPLEGMSQLAFTSNDALCQTYTSLLYKLQTDVLDALQFTELHRFIVGIAKGSVYEQLALNPHSVNQSDSGGQTPLFWAVTRGDAATVSTLLKYGADPNVRNKLQETPLNWATEAADSSCTTLLLSHGAQPSPHSIFGTTPLHYAAWTEDSSTTPHVDALLQFGADPNARNNRGLTPLHYAVPNSSNAAIEKILNAGADIDSRDDEGLTPLLEATRNDSVDAIRFLLQKGADPAVRTLTDASIAHILAEHGTVATMEKLTEDASSNLLATVDFDAKDASGHTPRNVLLQRRDCESSFLEAFDVLENKVVAKFATPTAPIKDISMVEKTSLHGWPGADKVDAIVTVVTKELELVEV